MSSTPTHDRSDRVQLKPAKGKPIQLRAAQGAEATVEVSEEFTEGLKDLDGFEHIWLNQPDHRLRVADDRFEEAGAKPRK